MNTLYWLPLVLLAVAAGARPGFVGVGYTPRLLATKARRIIRHEPDALVITPVRVIVAVAALVLWSGLRAAAWGAVAAAAVCGAALVFLVMCVLFGMPPATPRTVLASAAGPIAAGRR